MALNVHHFLRGSGFIYLKSHMKKFFLIFAFFLIPFSVFADETATSTMTVNVRYQDSLVFSGPIELTNNSSTTISDNSGTNRQVPSDSALIALKTADDISADFNLSDLVYYSDFNSLYVNCIDITSPAKHACANWQYVVNSNYPPIGMDKYIVSNGDTLYFYFGNPRRVLISSPSVEVTKPVKVKAENYDYVNNAWTALSGVDIGATQPNPNDPYSPLVISRVTSDANGFADLILGKSGSYNIGLALDYYFPGETLSVSEPPVEEVKSSTGDSGTHPSRRQSGQTGQTEVINETIATSSPMSTSSPQTLGQVNKIDGTAETLIKMDVSMNDFIKNYQIALQIPKFVEKKVPEVDVGNQLPVGNQTASVINALEPKVSLIQKIFNGIANFFGFKK